MKIDSLWFDGDDLIRMTGVVRFLFANISLPTMTVEDHLESLQNTIDLFKGEMEVGEKRKSVSFNTTQLEREFYKTEPPTKLESETEAEANLEEPERSFPDDFGGEDDSDYSSDVEEENEEGSLFDIKSAQYLEDEEYLSQSEDEKDGFSEESSDDGSESDDDNKDPELDLDSLTPAQQLSLLMADVSDEDSDSAAENDDDEEEYLDGLSDLDENEYPASDNEDKEEMVNDDATEAIEPSQPLTKFERQQAKLTKSIKQFEQENVSSKQWPMQGEVKAEKRPVNSLLEHDLDFDFASNSAPIITEEVTGDLERIIIERIKEGSWDDVERKHRQDMEAKPKPVVLDQEKSKESLLDVYTQSISKNEEPIKPTNKEHEEILGLFTKICRKIDCLSNFKFVPRAHNLADLTVKSAKSYNGNK